MGAIAGGALGHGITKSDKNKLKGALKGAGAGALYSAVAPSAFQAFGGTPASTGFFPAITGAHHPSLLHQLGFKSAPGMGGGLGLYGNLGNKGLLEKGMFEKGLLSSLPGGDLLKPHLASAFSQLGGKRQPFYAEAGTGYDPYGYSESVISHAQPMAMPMAEAQETSQEREKKRRIEHIVNDKQTSAMEKLMQLLQMLEGDKTGQGSAMQARKITHKDVSPQKIVSSLTGLKGGGKVKGQAQRKGYVKGGYISGKSGGQADDVPIGLRPGSFVMDATTVSLYGDGNSENGARKLQQDLKKMEKSFVKSPYAKLSPQSNNVRTIANNGGRISAKVSPGELIVDKRHVDMIGRGDNRTGAKVLDTFRKNLRKHKGVQPFLPKKSKSFGAYVGRVH
jgi:hypothetical protein